MPPTATPPRVLLFSTVHPPFIAEDERILAHHFRVEKLIAHGLPALLRLPFLVARNDIIYTWFGSVYAGWNVFFARMLGKKSIIVIGGVDATKEPSIGYGIWLTPWKAAVVRYAFRHADRLLAVDPCLQRRAAHLAEYDGGNIQWVPTGYNAAVWTPDGRKEQRVLVVASCNDQRRMRTKGIDWLLRVARLLPDTPFTLVGVSPAFLATLRRDLPPNVEAVPFVMREGLLGYYRRAKVYCQPSFVEGLPNTLCEAMLCGCVPVGSRVGGIPTAIGDTGYLVDYGDDSGLVRALRAALQAPETAGLSARERIVREFPLARREASLRKVIEELCV